MQLFTPTYTSRYSNWHVYLHVPTCEQSRAQPRVHTAVPLEPKVCVSHTVVSDSLWPHGLKPARLLCPWDSPGRNTRMGCHFLLQGIFPTQKSNSCHLHWQVGSLPLSHLGRPCIIFHIHNSASIGNYQHFPVDIKIIFASKEMSFFL